MNNNDRYCAESSIKQGRPSALCLKGPARAVQQARHGCQQHPQPGASLAAGCDARSTPGQNGPPATAWPPAHCVSVPSSALSTAVYRCVSDL